MQQMQMQQQQNAPPPPPEVQAAMQKALSTLPADLCDPQVMANKQMTNVGEACWKKIWKHVGCETDAPSYEQWHAGQNFEVLVVDAAQWSALPSAKHRQACYGRTEL